MPMVPHAVRLSNLYAGLAAGDACMRVAKNIQQALALIPDGSITAVNVGSHLTPSMRPSRRR